MHRMRIVPAAKLFQLPLVNKNLHHGRSNFMKTMTPACALVVYSNRNFYSSKPIQATKPSLSSRNKAFLERILSKTHMFNPRRYRLMHLGYLLYQNVVDSLDYEPFYKEFKMPDTFNSWFLVTELHVWLMMVRCMAEGSEGQIVRNHIVKAMWQDCDQRGKKLDSKEHRVNISTVRKQMWELSAQFNAYIIAYDEGLTGDDKILASAIWRRIFRYEGNDPEKLEKLVHYIRKQNQLLEELSWDEIFQRKKIDWKGLNILNSD